MPIFNDGVMTNSVLKCQSFGGQQSSLEFNGDPGPMPDNYGVTVSLAGAVAFIRRSEIAALAKLFPVEENK